MNKKKIALYLAFLIKSERKKQRRLQDRISILEEQLAAKEIKEQRIKVNKSHRAEETEADKRNDRPVPFELRSMLTSIVDLFRFSFEKKGAVLQLVKFNSNEKYLSGDRLRICEVINELISDILEAAGNGDVVKISAETEVGQGGALELNFILEHICDSEGKLNKLKQLHGAKENLRNMNGRLQAIPQRQGKYILNVRIPVESSEKRQFLRFRDLESLNALILDEVCSNSRTLERLLRSFDIGYQYTRHEELFSVLEEGKKAGIRYHFCFLNWDMASFDGEEAILRIREEFQDVVQIIIVLSYDKRTVAERAACAGANLCVARPLEKSYMHTILSGLSAGRVSQVVEDERDYNFDGCKVMLIGENEVEIGMIGELLEMAEVTVEYVNKRTEALKRFGSSMPHSYHIIIIGSQSKGSEAAIDTVQAIRKSGHPDARRVKILTIEHNEATDEDKTDRDEIDGCISVPIDAIRLYDLVDRYYEKDVMKQKN